MRYVSVAQLPPGENFAVVDLQARYMATARVQPVELCAGSDWKVIAALAVILNQRPGLLDQVAGEVR